MAEESTNKPTRRTERIGKYEILGHIATGGMGVIYKARDVKLDRLVALKLLPAELATQSTMLERFRREAKAASELRHENIVTLFDFDECDGIHFIALEYIDGTDLQDYINRKCRLDPEEARQIIIQATRALMHAHEHGIVHRDIKPSNFLLMLKDQRIIVKLTDFGLAIRQENDAEFRITRAKTTVGTVDYMSPEQARDSRSADIRSDIYSLGCTFYHMLGGNAPFAQGTLPERIVKHMQAPPDMRKLPKNVPEDLVAIIHRMLAKKPAERYQTPAELLHDLEHPDGVVALKPMPGPPVKLQRGPARKPVEPTQVIENKDMETEEPKPVRTAKVKRAAAIDKGAEKAKEAAKPRPSEEATPREVDEDADTDYDEPYEEPIEEKRPAPEKLRKKAVKGSPAWIYATAGSVGVLGLVLIIAVAFGSRTPQPKKEVVKPPPVFVEPPEVKLEKPPVIDTDPKKMTVAAPKLEIMDLHPDKADQAALRREYYGPFTAPFPVAPADATVLRVRRLAAPGADTFRSLAEAFAQTKAKAFTVIEIHDNGPIFVPLLPAVVERQILVRGGGGFRPLLVWDVPKKPAAKKPVSTFCSVSQGKLILDNLDFVMRWSEDGPATCFDLPDTDFHARDCTFSIGGRSKEGISLVRRYPALPDGRVTQTWLKRCYVRGADLSLLRLQNTSSAVLLEDSLIVGYQPPMIQVRGRDEDSLSLYCVRSTLVTGQVMVRWQPVDGKPSSPQLRVRLLDSILSRDDATAPQGDMIQLAGGADLIKLSWAAANGVYAGWKNLLTSDAKKIDGGDIEKWHNQWFYRAGDRAIVDCWPNHPPSGLDEQPANTFFPGQSPVGFAALTSPVATGCVIGWLPPVPDAWIERAFEPRALAVVPGIDKDVPKIQTAGDGLYHGEHLDLNKVDLGAYLNDVLQKKPPAPRVVMHLTGKGLCQTSPLRVKGVQHLVLYFEEMFTLEYNPTSILKSPPMIEMTGGHLEVIGLRVKLLPITVVPTVIHLHESNLTMTHCWLQGPLTRSAQGFKNLVTASNTSDIPTTLLLRENVLVSGTALIHLQDHVQLKARNNVFLSLGDGVHVDANSPSVPLVHLLDHNTWAIRQAFFTLRTGPAFQPVGRVLVQANSNAFLHPFADDAKKAESPVDEFKSVFVRGGEAWVASGRWNWQGRFNVYDARLHAYFGGLDKPAGAKQPLRDWQATWGQAGEQDAIPLPPELAAKLITLDTVLRGELDRLALPKQLRGDLNQAPPGANQGILKRKG